MVKNALQERTISTNAIKQVGCALAEIASLARVINRNSITSIQELHEGDDAKEALEALIVSNEHLSAQVGFLSDLCAGKINSFVMNGDAEQWLLPPAYNALSEST